MMIEMVHYFSLSILSVVIEPFICIFSHLMATGLHLRAEKCFRSIS